MVALLTRLRDADAWLRHKAYMLGNNEDDCGERVNPDCADENFENHRKVYLFASQFVAGKDVLDCGSGNGYGTDLLAETAKSAIGIDFSQKAVAFSTGRYSRPNLSYLEMDAQDIGLPDDSLDVVLTTENLEHLPRPEDNIREIRRLLRPGGLAIVATPNKEVSSPGLSKPSNPWHIKEFTYEELRDMLLEHFSEVHIFESTLPSPRRVGRSMKKDRVQRGVVGLDGTGGGTTEVGGRTVDLTYLHNTHSFVALAW